MHSACKFVGLGDCVKLGDLHCSAWSVYRTRLRGTNFWILGDGCTSSQQGIFWFKNGWKAWQSRSTNLWGCIQLCPEHSGYYNLDFKPVSEHHRLHRSSLVRPCYNLWGLLFWYHPWLSWLSFISFDNIFNCNTQTTYWTGSYCVPTSFSPEYFSNLPWKFFCLCIGYHENMTTWGQDIDKFLSFDKPHFLLDIAGP